MTEKSDQHSVQKKGMPESPTEELQYEQEVGNSNPRILRKNRKGMIDFPSHLLLNRRLSPG